MKKILKETNQKGITLVALVITIVILLILAGISIQVLTNQGIFAQAQKAKNLTEEKTAEESEILTNYLEQMNEIIGGQVTEAVLDGAVITPINDITTWLKTGGMSKQYSYTTIEQVIADSTCTQSLMKNENAMKYLARSTEFADAICASETIMTYLGQSPYVEDTVLNSDLWKQKIKLSQCWEKVYDSKTVTVYGAANETITIDGYGVSFTTGTDGSCSHVVPMDIITLTGSVSGQSFIRTVNSNTTEIKLMPDGDILYWYGVNYGGFDLIDTTLFPYLGGAGRSTPNHSFQSDHILTTGTKDACAGIVFTNKIFSLGEYSTFHAIVDVGAEDWYSNIFLADSKEEQFKYVGHNGICDGDGNLYYPPVGMNNFCIPIKEKGRSNFYIAMGAVHTCSNKIYAMWLE